MCCSCTAGRLSINYSAKIFFSLTLSGFELHYLIICLRFLLFFFLITISRWAPTP